MAERVLSLEERVSRLEGWKESEERLVNGIRQDLHDLKERITHLEERMNERFLLVEAKINNLEERMNERFTLVESRINHLEQEVNERINYLEGQMNERMNHLEAQMNERITNLERKVDTYFRWMVGFQFTILLAIVSLLLRLISG